MRYWSKAAQQLADLVEREMDQLRAIPFEDLATMQDGGHDVEIKGRTGHIHRFVERPEWSSTRILLQGPVPSSSIKIVLQGSVPSRILGSHYHVVGFVKTREGSCRELDGSELYPYS